MAYALWDKSLLLSAGHGCALLYALLHVTGCVVSIMPSTEIFATQSPAYRDSALPSGVSLLVIEAGVSLGCRSYIGPRVDVVGVGTFGASAPGPAVTQHQGFSVENVCERARAVVSRVGVKA